MTVPRSVAIAVVSASTVAWLVVGALAAAVALRDPVDAASGAGTAAAEGIAELAVSAWLRGDRDGLAALADGPLPEPPAARYPGRLAVTAVDVRDEEIRVEVTGEVLRAGPDGYVHDGLAVVVVRLTGDPPRVAALESPGLDADRRGPPTDRTGAGS